MPSFGALASTLEDAVEAWKAQWEARQDAQKQVRIRERGLDRANASNNAAEADLRKGEKAERCAAQPLRKLLISTSKELGPSVEESTAAEMDFARLRYAFVTLPIPIDPDRRREYWKALDGAVAKCSSACKEAQSEREVLEGDLAVQQGSLDEARRRKTEAIDAESLATGRLQARVDRLNEIDTARRGEPEKWKELNTRGYTVFAEQRLELPTLEQIEGTKFEAIANNGHDAKGNPKKPPSGVKGRRFHGRKALHGGGDAAWVAPFDESARAWLGANGLNWLATTTARAPWGDKTVRATHALMAGVDEEGNDAHTPRQDPLHADSCRPNSHAAARAPWGDAHLAMIVALEDGTTLHVCPFDSDGEEEEIPLNAGDVLVFRGDLIHAGAAYDARNVRIHCYIDSLSAPEPRDPTETYPVGKGGASCHWPI